MEEKKFHTEIKYNVINGIVWDGKAIEAVNTVAKALLNLTEIFNAQHINMTMIRVEGMGEYEGTTEDKPEEESND